EVTLEILGADGALVRRFSSASRGAGRPGAPDMATGSFGGGSEARLEKGAGMHRFIWDLRYPGAWDPDRGAPEGRGPMAVPGSYQARLTAGGRSTTQTFRVYIDPRVAEDGVTQEQLQEQLAFNLEVRDALSLARKAAVRVDSLLAGIDQAAAEAGDAAAAPQELDRLRAALVTHAVRYSQPMLIDQLEYLLDMTTRADQQPGRDAYARYDQLRGELAAIEEALDRIERSDAAARR
ncbi:MAG: hypothetical protein JSW43_03310, partial [Gemmatimonadota bacterium]